MMTGDFMLPVLDHQYFGGRCEYVYNGEWRKFTYDAMCENLSYNDELKNFRKPYNYHTYRFMVGPYKHTGLVCLLFVLIIGLILTFKTLFAGQGEGGGFF